MFKSTTLAAAALCTAALFAAPAAFAETRSTEVRFNDLDLASTGGQQQLQSRIEKAARTVCTAQQPTTGSILKPVDRVCYSQAMANARQHVAAAIEKADATRLGG